MKRPYALVILDGWGLSDRCDNNAFCRAQTPRLDALLRDWPSTRLGASGLDVGLPEGQMGNSEVGHQNIGAGRVVYQDFTRISKSIAEGDFFTNPAINAAIKEMKQQGGRLHLLGLVSDGGVHSHLSHLYALVELARRRQVEELFIHAFLDGRDTPPRSGAGFLEELEERLRQLGLGQVATVCGRYYAMDRDNRWDRVEKAYRALTAGEGEQAASAGDAIAAAYRAGENDEFVLPRVVVAGDEPVGTIRDGDAVIFFNFRTDRARELTRAFTQDDFDGFDRRHRPQLAAYVCMTEYDETFELPVAFPPASYPHLLGEVIAAAGLTQLRIAETEKYAHVTFFFNGGSETPYPGEERVLIPSPQEVATYDEKPEMSALQVTDEVVARIEEGRFDLIVLNFANPDMVGHTGLMDAAIAAMETVDDCVGRVVDAVLAAGGGLLITADHGNCEQMTDDRGEPQTAHSSNPVPLLLIDPSHRQATLQEGILADIAPTLLNLMGLPVPPEMTGRNLVTPP